MPRRDKDWRGRRGIGRGEREWNEPWERLRTALVTRHRLDVGVVRRWERPDVEDAGNLPLLLRQASAAVDADVARILAGRSPRLSPVELDTLRRIAAKPSVGVSLSEYLRLSPARICRILARLEGAGLVARAESHLDGRVRRAEATDEGLEFLRSVNEDLGSMAALWLDGLEEGADRALVPLIAVLADLT
jgi:DNA-binding MarR family transcriptional regulator